MYIFISWEVPPYDFYTHICYAVVTLNDDICVLKGDSDIQDTPTTDYSHTEGKTKRTESKEKLDFSDGTIAIASSDDVNAINEKVHEYMEKCADGSYRCNVCGKMSRTNLRIQIQKHNMMKHIETHMDGLTFNCQVCQKTFRSRDSLRNHKFRNHHK